MSKFIDVGEVVFPKVTADIDWSMAEHAQTTRDLIEYWQKEQEYRQKIMMGNWAAAPRINGDDFLSSIHEGMMQDNPLAEMFRHLLEKCDRVNGPFSWFWDDCRRYDHEKRFLARLDINISKDPYSSNPFEQGSSSRTSVSATIRGHGDGDAFAKSRAWRLSGRTRDFLSLLKPLIRQMGRAEPDLLINAVFDTNGLNSRYGVYSDRHRNNIDILGISLSIGDLLVFCDFKNRDNFDVQCNHIGHSVFHLCDRGVNIKNAREALLICNKNETLFTFRWDEKLRNMMAGDTPSPEELMMMEMAGYKDEFWLDNIDGFDTLKIKPFNMMEQEKWYALSIPRFQF